MKREYQKPQLYAETFMTHEHIAKDCSAVFKNMGYAHFQDRDHCAFSTSPNGGTYLFTLDLVNSCELDGYQFEGLLEIEEYHGGTITNVTMFSS